MGSWVHPRANENWEMMDTIRSQPTPDGSQRSEPNILSEVLGTRLGYVRGLGHGAKLMTPAKAASSQSVAGESALHRVDIAERERERFNSYESSSMRSKSSWRGRGRRSRGVGRRRRGDGRIEEMWVEHERRMQEMFQALAARFATDAPPPPPSSL
ncbi:uncharacterized protein LOC131229793 [Magnolia sinica]|uniref:uncharacterized protein LOC131229793 n=1 Tax=Magnolia sinica TaxID=86752 RepID=UPI00265955B6|nr:uncharacterized protein LOC131229793 [Magnolia sinica]